MTTFLIYVTEALFGPPCYGSSWKCPFCDPGGDSKWASFSVRPPRKKGDGTEYPIKWRCHRCRRWGDEYDLLRLLYPGEQNRAFRREERALLYSGWLLELSRSYGRSPLGDNTTGPSRRGGGAASTIAQRGRGGEEGTGARIPLKKGEWKSGTGEG